MTTAIIVGILSLFVMLINLQEIFRFISNVLYVCYRFIDIGQEQRTTTTPTRETRFKKNVMIDRIVPLLSLFFIIHHGLVHFFVVQQVFFILENKSFNLEFFTVSRFISKGKIMR